MIPNFLVVGSQRCGTTWLFQRFLEHEEIYVPRNRKEVEYFDKNYHKGLGWYRKFFKDSDSERHIAIGEITPNYILSEEALTRIKSDLGGVKIIVLIRDPVDRAISEYKYWVKNFNEKSSLSEFCKSNEVLKKGMYASQIKYIYDLFGRNHCYVLVYEELMSDPELQLKKLGVFMGVSAECWDLKSVNEKVNTSEGVRFHLLFVLLRKLGQLIRLLGCDKVVEHVKNSVVMVFFKKSQGKDYIEKNFQQEKKSLYEIYRGENEDLKKTLGRRVWK